MIKVHINGESKDVGEAGLEQWVARNINGRRHDGVRVCVRVEIRLDNVNLSLTSYGCAQGGYGGRPPNSKEAKIIDLWNRRMDQPDFSPGDLIGFLHQFDR